MKLNVVICSTRPGRIGPKVGAWFAGYARKEGSFDVDLIDLADFNLPIMDEPKHPRLGDYQHAHTKKWAKSVAAADAFAFVMPEYNFFAPPSLVNALDYLSNEWSYKPAGLVGYGGVSGGLRAVQAVKPLITSLRMMPLPESVAMPMVHSLVGENGELKSNDLIDASAKTMLGELAKWAGALKPLRG